MQKNNILEALKSVPYLNSNIVDLGILSSLAIKDKSIGFILDFTEQKLLDIKSYDSVKKQCEEILTKLGASEVKIIVTDDSDRKSKKIRLPADKVIIVASGKGGVGKSFIASNLATHLANKGKKVGIIDADITGPSLGQIFFGQNRPEPESKEGKLIPIEKYGLKILSMAFLADEGVVWRGPMLSKALNQLLIGANWGDSQLDYLIIDTPPGTSDIHLSILGSYLIDGSVIVTTPQKLSEIDVRKAENMFSKMNVPNSCKVLNMSYFEDSQGNKNYIFGKSKEKSSVEIPIIPRISELADSGYPAILELPSLEQAFDKIVKNL